MLPEQAAPSKEMTDSRVEDLQEKLRRREDRLSAMRESLAQQTAEATQSVAREAVLTDRLDRATQQYHAISTEHTATRTALDRARTTLTRYRVLIDRAYGPQSDLRSPRHLGGGSGGDGGGSGGGNLAHHASAATGDDDDDDDILGRGVVDDSIAEHDTVLDMSSGDAATDAALEASVAQAAVHAKSGLLGRYRVSLLAAKRNAAATQRRWEAQARLVVGLQTQLATSAEQMRGMAAQVAAWAPRVDHLEHLLQNIQDNKAREKGMEMEMEMVGGQEEQKPCTGGGGGAADEGHRAAAAAAAAAAATPTPTTAATTATTATTGTTSTTTAMGGLDGACQTDLDGKMVRELIKLKTTVLPTLTARLSAANAAVAASQAASHAATNMHREDLSLATARCHAVEENLRATAEALVLLREQKESVERDHEAQTRAWTATQQRHEATMTSWRDTARKAEKQTQDVRMKLAAKDAELKQALEKVKKKKKKKK